MKAPQRHPPPLFPSESSPLPTFRERLGATAGVLVAWAALAAPAAAQWSRVTAVPAGNVFALSVEHDTLAAATDTLVFVSTDGGDHWRPSARLAPNVSSIQAVRLHQGRLFAGTFGQGVFVSSDLGATWHAFNQGLTGGVLDSQLFLSSFEVRDDSLFAGTFGAGVYERKLTGASWSHFGDVFEPEQASNVNTIALGGTRLIAAAGSNGMVFRRDPGELDWTPSGLGPNGAVPGLQAHSLLWTGSGWVVGTSSGVFLSPTGTEPWSLSSLGVVPIRWSALALRRSTVFAAFDEPTKAVIEFSRDGGASWHFLEAQTGVFVFALAVHGEDLFAARADGLWRRATRVQHAPPLLPAVSAVTPDHGPNSGSTVVITGSGFTHASAVSFGADAASFTVDDDTQITAKLEATPATGFVDVSVANAGGTSTLTRGFDLFAPPRELGSPCTAATLTFSGAPTLGQKYSVTTLNLGGSRQFLLVDRSSVRPGRPHVRRQPPAPCAALIVPDMILNLGTDPHFSFGIPNDVRLLGEHLRTQAVILSPFASTQVLDATIGE